MISKRHSFFVLLAGLLVTLLLAPITYDQLPGVAGLLSTVTLLVAVSSMSASKRVLSIVWLLVGTKIALDVIRFVHPSPEVSITEAVVLFAFFVLVAASIFRRVLEGDEVDMNRIAGAISVYMLIGLIWSSLYFFLAILDSQAFDGLTKTSTSDARHLEVAFLDFLYYSYVTLSTLGYGDITPMSHTARALAYLESICGVMYVAVLVSALVGSYGKTSVARA